LSYAPGDSSAEDLAVGEPRNKTWIAHEVYHTSQLHRVVSASIRMCGGRAVHGLTGKTPPATQLPLEYERLKMASRSRVEFRGRDFTAKRR